MNRDIPIKIKENLKELNFGNWEGKTKEDIELHSIQQYNNMGIFGRARTMIIIRIITENHYNHLIDV